MTSASSAIAFCNNRNSRVSEFVKKQVFFLVF